MARDVAPLMQAEVGEASAPGGASSALPQKRNPAGCAIALAAATRVPGLVSAFLSAMVQEHERAVGGWHAEWPTIAAVIQTTGAALASMADVADTIIVDPDRMRENVEATRGAVCAERAMMLLARRAGRDEAHRLISDAVDRSRDTGKGLSEVLRTTPEVARVLSSDQIESVEKPEEYLGAAETFRQQLLAAARHRAKE